MITTCNNRADNEFAPVFSILHGLASEMEAKVVPTAVAIHFLSAQAGSIQKFTSLRPRAHSLSLSFSQVTLTQDQLSATSAQHATTATRKGSTRNRKHS